VGAVVEAWHLDDVGIELLYMTYKLIYVDVLGLLKYIGDIVLFLLCRIDGERGEQMSRLVTSKSVLPSPCNPVGC
jgi:hypothetical protein